MRSGDPGQSNLPNRPATPLARRQQGVTCLRNPLVISVRRVPSSKALADRGITAPFPVQRLVVPDVLAGRDVLVKSPTGSGKTLAFACRWSR